MKRAWLWAGMAVVVLATFYLPSLQLESRYAALSPAQYGGDRAVSSGQILAAVIPGREGGGR